MTKVVYICDKCKKEMPALGLGQYEGYTVTSQLRTTEGMDMFKGRLINRSLCIDCHEIYLKWVGEV